MSCCENVLQYCTACIIWTVLILVGTAPQGVPRQARDKNKDPRDLHRWGPVQVNVSGTILLRCACFRVVFKGIGQIAYPKCVRKQQVVYPETNAQKLCIPGWWAICRHEATAFCATAFCAPN